MVLFVITSKATELKINIAGWLVVFLSRVDLSSVSSSTGAAQTHCLVFETIARSLVPSVVALTEVLLTVSEARTPRTALCTSGQDLTLQSTFSPREHRAGSFLAKRMPALGSKLFWLNVVETCIGPGKRRDSWPH